MGLLVLGRRYDRSGEEIKAVASLDGRYGEDVPGKGLHLSMDADSMTILLMQYKNLTDAGKKFLKEHG